MDMTFIGTFLIGFLAFAATTAAAAWWMTWRDQAQASRYTR